MRTLTRTLSALLFSATMAAAITLLPGSDKVSASAPLNSGKGDRIDVRAIGPACSENAWPYFEAACTKDRRQPMSQAKAVRIVTPDRTLTH